MFNSLKKVDLIAKIPSTRLHFGDDAKHRTVAGGVCTLLAFACFLFLAGYQGLKI